MVAALLGHAAASGSGTGPLVWVDIGMDRLPMHSLEAWLPGEAGS
ncbi:hypothetical protein D779_3823 [Imhoffiella purpurea]|uniref:Uncharacterized protein n=1 Tax=Imhoffiella purpurea TaxID=1249627 RepID=W9V932_9GAMM|nr:hypothetical protein D779_3823 [Imhoffiella purpurea]